MKKFVCLLLVLTLILSLAACGKGDKPNAGAAAGGLDLEGLMADLEFLPDNGVDLSRELMDLPGDTPVASDGAGTEASARVYLYWLGNLTSYYKTTMYYYYGIDLDLNEEVAAGVTWEDRLGEMAYQNTVLMALIPQMAGKYGVTLTREEVDALYQTRLDDIEVAGGEEMYAYQLQLTGISDRENFRMDILSALFDKIQSAYAQRVTGEITPGEMAEYIGENDLLRAKHILRLTKDMTTGEEYDEVTQREQLTLMEDLAARLATADDLEATFDGLMREYSEDGGLAANPDGYLFTAGQMVSEFEEGTRALGVGEVSPIIKSTYGYHIILRLDADCDQTRGEVAAERFNTMVTDYIAGSGMEKRPALEGLKAGTYYDKLLAFGESHPAPGSEETAAPSEP